jgi:UDP-perosamine 4-acetyltransferase
MRVIYCAGEQGRVVSDILRARKADKDVVFVDDDESRHGSDVDGVSVVGGFDRLREFDEGTTECLVAFGDERGTRLTIAERVDRAGFEFFRAVHPSASVSETASVGRGVTVNAQSYVGPGSALGDHVLVDSDVTVSHDVELGEGATVTPGVTLAGGVSAGRDAYVGPGATVVEDVRIGERSLVGAGAVVTDDVPADTTVVGVPARPVEE